MTSKLADPRVVTKPNDPRRFTPTMDITTASALNVVQGSFTRAVMGVTGDVVAGSFRDLWPLAATVGEKVWPTAVGAVSIVSTDTGDADPAGAGGRRMLIRYLTADFTEIRARLKLDGTTPVTEDEDGVPFQSAIRVNALRVLQSGSDNTAMNLGTITASIAGVPQYAMAIGTNRAYSAAYTIPKGKIGFVTGVVITADSANTIDFQTRINGEAFFSAFLPSTKDSFFITQALIGPLPVGADLRVRAKGSAAADVMAGFQMSFFNSQTE